MRLVFYIPISYLLFVKFAWSCQIIEDGVHKIFKIALLNDSVIYQYIVHTFSVSLSISLTANRPLSLLISFCKDTPGELVAHRHAIINLNYKPFELYVLRNRTKCEQDADPFYEQVDNVNKRLKNSNYLLYCNNCLKYWDCFF